MNGPDRPWDDIHHRSYFLPELVRIEQDDFSSTLSEMVNHVVVPLDTHGIYAEGNMENISPTITIDISQIPSKIENVYIGVDCSPEEIRSFSWSYEKRLGINPCIIEHEIKTSTGCSLFQLVHDVESILLIE
jgi:hypothetical protein